MQESLYDRFRAFKPYDLVLALSLLVLVAPTGKDLQPAERALTLLGGLLVFCLLDAVQRLVRVPTPLWQCLAMICTSTAVVVLLTHLHGAYQYSLVFAMLNTTFAAVAFGQLAGIATALLTVVALSQISAMPGGTPAEPAVWMLFLVVLLTLVAILVRISRLQQDALYDMVTGLRNHRYFQVRLREELQRSERAGQPSALVMIDLDNFKRINDQHGHARGDEVLRLVAATLVRSTRQTDVVCRYGGEELAVIMPGTPRADAMMVAERLRRAVAEQSGPNDIRVTVSVGVACYPEHSKLADGLIAASDAAMYRAKNAGKNRVECADLPVSMGQEREA